MMSVEPLLLDDADRRSWPVGPTLAEELARLGPEEILDMRVLEPDQTGVPFLVWISTRMASHGPRVKGYLGRSGSDQPSFSMTVSAQPEVVASSYSDRETNHAAAQLAPWVRANADALKRLWHEGNGWTDREVRAFVDGLEKV
jgi:hypothetical protein